MLVVYNNSKSIHYSDRTPINPIETNDLLVVALDPSKTNFAMVVGSPDGRLLEVVEFSGNNRSKGPVMDTTQYCHELRSFFSKYFEGKRLYVVGTEAAITQKGEKNNHLTNMVLTEIRASILGFFYDMYGINVIQINNWSWKHSELPEGYRSPFEKMSKLYLKASDPTNPLIDYFHEDACDAYFMYKYLVKQSCQGFTLICDSVEEPRRNYDYYITICNELELPYTKVIYNSVFTLKENIAYYTNRFSQDFYFVVPINDLKLDDIYMHCKNINESILYLREAAVVVSCLP